MSIADDIAGVFDTLAELDLAAPITLTSVAVAGAYDLNTSTRALSATDYVVTGTVGECKKALRPEVNLVEGDVLILVPALALAVEPQAGWKATVAGKTYAIVAADIARPGAGAILYQLQGRRARA